MKGLAGFLVIGLMACVAAIMITSDEGKVLFDQGAFSELTFNNPLERAVCLGGDLVVTTRPLSRPDSSGRTVMWLIEDSRGLLLVQPVNTAVTLGDLCELGRRLERALGGRDELWRHLGRAPNKY